MQLRLLRGRILGSSSGRVVVNVGSIRGRCGDSWLLGGGPASIRGQSTRVACGPMATFERFAEVGPRCLPKARCLLRRHHAHLPQHRVLHGPRGRERRRGPARRDLGGADGATFGYRGGACYGAPCKSSWSLGDHNSMCGTRGGRNTPRTSASGSSGGFRWRSIWGVSLERPEVGSDGRSELRLEVPPAPILARRLRVARIRPSPFLARIGAGGTEPKSISEPALRSHRRRFRGPPRSTAQRPVELATSRSEPSNSIGWVRLGGLLGVLL